MILLISLALAVVPLPKPRPGFPAGNAWRDEGGPQGFRVDMDGDRTAFQTRLGLVQDLDGAFFAETTVRGQLAWRRLGFSGEVVATGGTSNVWSGAGIGNVRLAFDVRFGRRDTHGLGLVGTLPVGNWLRGENDWVGWWGTVPRATLPTTGLSLFYAVSSGEWVWRIDLGVERVLGFTLLGIGPFASTAVVWVHPVSDGWSLVAEAELYVWRDPLQLRVLARKALPRGWAVDVGTAIPVPAIVLDPTVQLVGQLQRAW